MSGTRQSSIAAPAPAAVARNLWRDLDVPDVGAVPGEATVQVLVDGADDAARTRAALAEQAYPAARIEVVDAGTTGAPAGDVAILLPAGATPSRELVAAHVRWHLHTADVVSLGPVERDGEKDSAFGLIADLTRSFSDPAHGLHVAAAAVGSLGLRTDSLEAVGGLGDERGWVGRLELAARLACYGAVFAPEPHAAARCRGGDGGTAVARAAAAAASGGPPLADAHPRAASLVPLPPFRAVASPRRHRRPAMVVNVDVTGAEPDDARATLEALLAGRMGDIELRVQGEPASAGGAAVASIVDADPRAAFAPSSLEAYCEVPFQVVMPVEASPDPRTLADLHLLIVEQEAGALHVTVPGAPPQDVMIEVIASGAWQRARRLAATSDESVEEILGRLFGERWVSGVEVSVRAHGVDEPAVTEHGPLAAATNIRHERLNHLRFRDRAEHLKRVTESLAARTMAERMKIREERRRAAALEQRLAATRKRSA